MSNRKSLYAQAADETFARINTEGVLSKLREAQAKGPKYIPVSELERSFTTIQQARSRDIVSENKDLFRVRNVFFEGNFYTVDVHKYDMRGSVVDQYNDFRHIKVDYAQGHLVPNMPFLGATMQRIYESKNVDALHWLINKCQNGIVTNTAYYDDGDETYVTHFENDTMRITNLTYNNNRTELFGTDISDAAYEAFFLGRRIDIDVFCTPRGSVKTKALGIGSTVDQNFYDLLTVKVEKE